MFQYITSSNSPGCILGYKPVSEYSGPGLFSKHVIAIDPNKTCSNVSFPLLFAGLVGEFSLLFVSSQHSSTLNIVVDLWIVAFLFLSFMEIAYWDPLFPDGGSHEVALSFWSILRLNLLSSQNVQEDSNWRTWNIQRLV